MRDLGDLLRPFCNVFYYLEVPIGPWWPLKAFLQCNLLPRGPQGTLVTFLGIFLMYFDTSRSYADLQDLSWPFLHVFGDLEVHNTAAAGVAAEVDKRQQRVPLWPSLPISYIKLRPRGHQGQQLQKSDDAAASEWYKSARHPGLQTFMPGASRKKYFQK